MTTQSNTTNSTQEPLPEGQTDDFKREPQQSDSVKSPNLSNDSEQKSDKKSKGTDLKDPKSLKKSRNSSSSDISSLLESEDGYDGFSSKQKASVLVRIMEEPVKPKKSGEGKEIVKEKPEAREIEKLEPGWEENLNETFALAKKYFIGEFVFEHYKLFRSYLPSSGIQLRLYYTRLEPIENKIASLCIIHGLGEHSGRYMEMADHFAKQGFVVHMIDLRGFGQSGYPRANGTIEEFHKDVEVLLRQASRKLPLFIYAHSLGCGITSSLLIRNSYLNIAGCIFTSGLYGFPKSRDMPWVKRFFIKAVGDQLGEVIVNVMINPTSLSKNNWNVRSLFDDRLSIPIIGMRMAKTLIELVDFILPNAYKFRYPCLIIHGNADTTTDFEDSVRFHNRITSEDKTLRVFEDGYHELQFDHEKEQLKKVMSDWLAQKMAKSPQKFGDIAPLKIGLAKRSIPKKLKLLLLIVVFVLYLMYFKR